MKIPIHNPKCSACGEPILSWIDIDTNRFQQCCTCGDQRLALLDIRLTKGQRLLIRSAHETMINEDFALSIVFSASAFEIDLRDYHRQWQILHCIKSENTIHSENPDEIFRKYYSVINKIKNTVKLAFVDGLERYCDIENTIKETLNNFPSLKPETLAEDIQKHLFVPRNEILHSGKVDFSKDDAIKAYNISRFGIQLLESIDDSMKRNNKI